MYLLSLPDEAPKKLNCKSAKIRFSCHDWPHSTAVMNPVLFNVCCSDIITQREGITSRKPCKIIGNSANKSGQPEMLNLNTVFFFTRFFPLIALLQVCFFSSAKISSNSIFGSTLLEPTQWYSTFSLYFQFAKIMPPMQQRYCPSRQHKPN